MDIVVIVLLVIIAFEVLHRVICAIGSVCIEFVEIVIETDDTLKGEKK